MRRLPTLWLCTLASAGIAAEGYILRQQPFWNLGWEERLAGLRDGSIQGGYSRQPLRMETGRWAQRSLRLRWASKGQHPLLPGDAPYFSGGQLLLDNEAAFVGNHLFLHGQPRITLGVDDSEDTVPAADPRAIWSGEQTYADHDQFDINLNITAGASGFGHILAFSTVPFRWGEGIFGGIVAGQSDQGFPHLVLAPQRAWSLFELAGDPLLWRYEFVTGLLDDQRNGPRDPYWTGGRTSLRWRSLTLSYSVGEQAGGSGVQDPDFLVFDIHEGDRGNIANGIHSLGLNWQLADRAEIRVEYGLDDNHPSDLKSDTPLLRQLSIWHPESAAWTATIDWLDITGDQDWRSALEWFRSESYFYDHSVYEAWSYEDTPIAHRDGGNAESLRWLLQHQYARGQYVNFLAYWRRLGWRNAAEGNPPPARQTPPGGSAFAVRAWDQFGIYTWSEHEFRWGGFWTLEAGLVYEENRLFNDHQDEWNWQCGLGWNNSW